MLLDSSNLVSDKLGTVQRSELREFANILDEIIKDIGFTAIQLER